MNGIRIRDLAQLDAGRKIDTLQCGYGYMKHAKNYPLRI